MAVAGGPDIVESGLVLCLDAGNSKSYSGGGTAWNDMGSFANHAVLVNDAAFSSSNGGCFSFDGTDATAWVPSVLGSSNFENTGNYSIQFFVFVDSTQPDPSSGVSVVEKWGGPLGTPNWGGSAPYPYSFRFVKSTNTMRLAVFSGNPPAPGYSFSNPAVNKVITRNEWHCVCGVLDWSSSLMSLYVDGVLGESTTISSSVNPYVANDSRLWLGSLGGYQWFFNGKIANLTAYNRALTAAEVAQNFAALRGRFGI